MVLCGVAVECQLRLADSDVSSCLVYGSAYYLLYSCKVAAHNLHNKNAAVVDLACDIGSHFVLEIL